ncbi:MAG: T9SS type A sorting domain-containing protein, partial [Bacteroidia bacterium]|nr:T9SS type A sorting domain-containing protein [Bacteroidia bacterium]NNM15684.1 T9SS type A sorting domain-containing protein [Bacteroidia bacterium]
NGCNAVGPFAPQNYPSVISEYRPNLSFKYDRPYGIFPINQGGHWENNGVFNAGLSNVIFDGTVVATQNITGTSTSTFNELTVNKVGTVTQIQPAAVNSIVRMTAGYFDLNQQTLTVTNPQPTAMVRTNGVILSDDPPPTYSFVQWDINATAGPHTIPFGNTGGTHMPFSFDQNGGSNIGSLIVGTYPTIPNNTPYPTGVTHVNGPLAGGDNSPNTVDRFWIINRTGGGAINADVTFSYANIDETALNPNDSKRPQRWITSLDSWENSGAAGTPFVAIPGARSVLRTGITSLTNEPWTISNDVSPLPIELVLFDAEAEVDKSKIWWVTASEINVDHFTIERTTDGHSFDFIDQQLSNSPSTQTQEYVAYDYAPLNGLQYYRLTSTDIDGSKEYSDLVPVYFGQKGTFEITSVFANNQSGTIDVLFEYDSELPLSYVVTDALGRVIAKEENLNAKEGTNLITLNSDLSKGIYVVTIMNTNKITSKKFSY